MSRVSLEPSRSQAKPVYQFIRGSCAVRDRYCEAINGFHVGVEPMFKSSKPSLLKAPILLLSCDCAMQFGRLCWRITENRIYEN